MRVISGRARGHRLKQVPGDTTRPIMDRVKESLFNIVGPAVRDARWLDLFAGTGQVGIEALSRGAREVVFVDSARAAINTIHANLRHTGLSEGAVVRHTDAFKYLRLSASERFDVIYVAPPQYHEIWIEVLQLLDGQPDGYLAPGGSVIVQIDPREYQELTLHALRLEDERRYGNTMLCFFSTD